MRKSWYPVLITSMLLASCSPAEYQVNPPTSEYPPTSEDKLNPPSLKDQSKAVTESSQKGYMRILGDLRWDQLTSNPEWRKRFKCLMSSNVGEEVRREIPKSENRKKDYQGIDVDRPWQNYYRKDGKWMGRFTDSVTENISPGHSLNGYGSVLAESPYGTYEKKVNYPCDFNPGGIPIRIYRVEFGSNSGTASKKMTDEIIFKFSDNSQSRAFKAALVEKYTYTTDGYCSKYTCWDLKDIDKAGPITATPTPYTISLLDQVKIDTSDL